MWLRHQLLVMDWHRFRWIKERYRWKIKQIWKMWQTRAKWKWSFTGFCVLYLNALNGSIIYSIDAVREEWNWRIKTSVQRHWHYSQGTQWNPSTYIWPSQLEGSFGEDCEVSKTVSHRGYMVPRTKLSPKPPPQQMVHKAMHSVIVMWGEISLEGIESFKDLKCFIIVNETVFLCGFILSWWFRNNVFHNLLKLSALIVF